MAKRHVSGRNIRAAARRDRGNPLPSRPVAPPPVPSGPTAQPIIGYSNQNATNIWIPIDKYLIRHYGWQTADKDGCMTGIICYSQGTLVGYLNFFNPDYVPQSAINQFTPPQPVLSINYHVERVQEVMATLRQEAVVHIGVDLSQRIGWVGIDPAIVGHLA
ncbi:MAG TPA: hypothetical protein VHJ58_17590 [Vicinamibacterales bacterium]|nr:hypothetical protein [Vicinamibacterales bacterium]